MFITSYLRCAALPAVALLVGSALAISAADGQTGRTLVFTGSVAHNPREAKLIDVRPRGQSIGDHYLVAGSIRAHGRIVGRAHAVCTIIDHRFRGQDCDFVFVFADGTVTASGGGINRLLPGQRPSRAPDTFAVTGGTGAYRGASGTMSLETKGDRETLTLSL
jgi:hypothetical protein